MFVVYRTIRSLRGCCIYKRFDVMAVRVWCQDKLKVLVYWSNTKKNTEDLTVSSNEVCLQLNDDVSKLKSLYPIKRRQDKRTT